MAKTAWRNGAPSIRNPPKDTLSGLLMQVCTPNNVIISQCIREGCSSRLCECCVCVCYHANCYIPGLYIGNKAAGLAYKFATW